MSSAKLILLDIKNDIISIPFFKKVNGKMQNFNLEITYVFNLLVDCNVFLMLFFI